MFKKLFLLSGLFALICTACSEQASSTKTAQTVKADTVKAYGKQGEMLFPGKVKPAEDVSIAFRVSGKIQKFHARVGSFVRKGQLLVEMDPRDYQIQLAATEAEYKQVKAEAERVMALYADNSTTANNNDKAVYGLQQITAKYDNHKNQLADTKIYAPFDGYVQDHLFDEHETVAAGMPVISMINKDMPEVLINIPASAYLMKDSIASFSCTFDVYPGETFPLTLVSMNQKANANQLFATRLKVAACPAGKMPAPGMAAMVKLTMKSSTTQQVVIPGTALFAEQGKSYVYVIKNNVLEKRAVITKELKSNGQAVLTQGLQPGEVVVATGVHHVSDKQQVKILAPLSKSNIGGLL